MSLLVPPGPAVLAMRTLAERCRVPALDPYAGQLEYVSEYYRGFDPLAEGAALRVRALCAPRHRPVYFLACLPYTANMQPRVVVAHHPFLYNAGPGAELSDLNGHAYISVGDLCGGQLPMLMELPACAFDATVSGGVETLTLLSEASLVQYFDDAPNAEDVALTEEFPAEWVRDIQVQRFVFLPHELVPFMIQGALSPKAAFIVLCPLIEARNLGRAGQNVKEWLIATCHRVDKVSPPLTSVGLAIRPPHHLDLMNSAQAVIF
jgi:hypothetical protein